MTSAYVAAVIALCLVLKVYWSKFLKRVDDMDYFKLSGVPRPKAVPPEFDIDKAKARPYRPLRWKYFQHLGQTCTRHLCGS